MTNRQFELDVPLPIVRYFAEKDSTATSPLQDIFTDNIVIWDNGEDLEIRGRGNVIEWLGSTNDKYKLNTEMQSCEKGKDGYVVRAVVSGDFPGSPYAFEYRFVLRDERIAELAIDPLEPVE